MIALHTPQQPYPDIASYIAIAITGDETQRHIGILFRNNKLDVPNLLHLAFHQRLYCEAPKYRADYHWLFCPNLSDDEQLQLSSRLKTIYERNKDRIPYGLAYSSSDYFHQDGSFNMSEQDIGLTCATFVMAIFEDFGFRIINTDSWESRAEDADWHHIIINEMIKDRANHPGLYNETHIDSQKNHIGIAARFRPEEVASAAHRFIDNPLTFEEVEPLGKDLLSKMLTRRFKFVASLTPRPPFI